MNDCLFCKIISGDVSASKVYEDERALAFLDIAPTNRGHTLVVPKEHHRNIFDTPPETMCHMMKTSKRVAELVRQATGAGGVNVYMNNEPAAGQVIFHAHIHIIPRFEDDELKLWKGGTYAEGEMEIVAEKIKKLSDI